MKAGPHPALAQGKVRYVGDHVAVVIAETLRAGEGRGRGGRRRIRRAAGGVDGGRWPRARRRCIHDVAPDNTVLSTGISATRRRPTPPSSRAKHVTKLDSSTTGSSPTPWSRARRSAITTRARIRLHALHDEPEPACRAPRAVGLHRHRAGAQAARHRAGRRRRLRLQDLHLCRGDGLRLGLAKQVGRPVKWTAERSESFLADAHGRDHVTHAELAIDAKARSPACACTRAPIWAPISRPSPRRCRPISTRRCCRASTTSRRSTPRSTRSTPTPRRSTPIAAPDGPEATYVVERLIEVAARELKMDPAEFRRKNFITQFPHQTPVIMCYDAGDYVASLDKALEWPTTRASASARRESARNGKLRGLGFSASSRPAASRRRRRSARSARASACGNRRR
jgi:carbon-monoxide dehydrogenase large subunit